MPEVIALPGRVTKPSFDDKTIKEMVASLKSTEAGQGVTLDEYHDEDSKARTRANKMRGAIMGTTDLKVRGHAVQAANGKWVPVLSLKR